MNLQRQLFAEFLGTTGLLIVVVGSGIMGENLSQGNTAVALLANSLATGAGLFALIQMFGPISGAHFNPVVSFTAWLSKNIDSKKLGLFIAFQILGGLTGVILAHVMFGQAIFQLSNHNRGELRYLASEIIATFLLCLVILLTAKRNPTTTPVAVSLYIVSAYWCTSSTSFANPAVTLARSFTDTFSGILWTGTPYFIFSQILGATLAFLTARYLS